MFATEYLPVIYGVVALLSAILPISYFLFDKKKNHLFLALLSCVAISNSGYFLLSVCNSLAVAKIANAASYFGGAFSMLVMLLIIYNVCQMKKRRWLMPILGAVSSAVFLLAASGDLLGLYYKTIAIKRIDGMTHLIKEYGPLHSFYAVYLAVYVVLMLVCIIYAAKEKRLSSPRYTLILLVSVLLNIGVWLVEQAINEEFEFLSISYIVTSILLLLIYNMLCDYGIMQPSGQLVSVQMLTQLNTSKIDAGALPENMERLFNDFSSRFKTLSAAELRIMKFYIEGYDIPQVPDLAFVSIHTVKKHNRSIYQKLELSSRDELMLYIELFRRCNRLDELTAKIPE